MIDVKSVIGNMKTTWQFVFIVFLQQTQQAIIKRMPSTGVNPTPIINTGKVNDTFEMPAVSMDKMSLPSFKVDKGRIPDSINRQLMGTNVAQRQLMGGGGAAPGPQPVIAPVQFPGILNPDIYIQNTQSAPVFPELNAPPVNLNLHIKGLEDYYKHKPKVIRSVHHLNFQQSRLKQLIQE
jgi:hypothetical protein